VSQVVGLRFEGEFDGAVVAGEAMHSVVRALAAVVSDDAETLAAWDGIAEKARADRRSMMAYVDAHDVRLSTPLAAMCLAGVIHGAEAGEATAAAAEVVDRLWEPHAPETGALRSAALASLLPLTVALSRILESETLQPPVAADVSRRLLLLAHTLRESARDVAAACAMSARSCASCTEFEHSIAQPV